MGLALVLPAPSGRGVTPIRFMGLLACVIRRRRGSLRSHLVDLRGRTCLRRSLM